MGRRLEIRVLGALEVERDGQLLDVRGSKRRAVLAMLVLHANEVVRTDRLIEDLWGAQPPANAQAALQNHVFRLRRDIGSDVLVTKPWGYVLRMELEAIDLRRFERLVSESRSLPAQERAAGLAEALALWRGAALADLAQEEGLAAKIDRLEELRLSAIEGRVDADLELGRHAELVRELEALVALCPLRERLRGQLILALYRSGRQAEALETYRETRRVLVEELGIEPSPELRELERAILRQDPALAVAPVPSSEPDVPPERSRWRWPRSPLGIAAALALVAGAGVLTAVVVARNEHATGAAAPSTSSPSSSVSTEKPSTSEPAQTSTATHVESSARTTTVVQPVVTTTTSQPEAPDTTHSPPTTVERTTVEQPITTTTTPKPPTTTMPTAPKLIRIVDAFASDTVNTQIWVPETLGTGVEMTQRNGRLEMTMHADATPDNVWNAITGHYSTSCSFIGDFDASIDYTLVDWPAANSAVVGIDVSFADDVVNLVRKSVAPGGEELYGFGAPSGAARQTRDALTTDTSGGFRMRRVGGLITAYYRSGGRWVKFAATRRAGAVRLNPTLWASGANFAHKDVSVAFDNFTLEFPQSSSPCTG